MQLLKPVWVSVEGHALMSVDIHPDGIRFATGGQGVDCGRVSIWNLRPILDEKAAKDKDVPKLLTQMDHHLGCVNCVRWSSNGKFLASGGDDKLVMIWQKSPYGGGSIFGGGGKVHVESWRLHQTLRGHNGDVLDLAWGPGDGLLATASIDNTVIIWNAENLPEMVKILRGHTGLVKGVIFDPVGKYMASQSDDRTLRIWRTSDWSEEKTIEDPFVDSGATTHVLRPGWSPDGSILVSAHAMNGGGPTAQIVERGGSWKTQRDFVGHKKAVTCTRFSNNLFKINNSKSGKEEIFVTIAMGSRDRSFSVWTTNLKRPLFVVNDVFDQSVLDLSWSPDGRLLLACSMDGSVAAVVLTDAEVGKALSQEKVQEMMVSQYGKNIGKVALAKSVINAKSNGCAPGFAIIENPEMLKTANQSKDASYGLTNGAGHNGITATNGPSNNSEGISSDSGGKVKLYPKGPTDKQIEARTSDGRRRITPIFIPPPSLENGEGALQNATIDFGNAEFGSSSTQERSKIAIELKNEIVTPNISPGKFSNDNSNSLMSQRVNHVNATDDKPTTSFSSIVTGQNGKVFSSNSSQSTQSKSSTPPSTDQPKRKVAEPDPTVKSCQFLVKRKPGPPSKQTEDLTKSATTTIVNVAQEEPGTSQGAGKRKTRVLSSSSEDEDSRRCAQKSLADVHDDSSSSIKELGSSERNGKTNFKEYGNSEKLKNLKMNKPDLISGTKRPTSAEDEAPRAKKRPKPWNSEGNESPRPLTSSPLQTTVIMRGSTSEGTLRLPSLKAYTSKTFTFHLSTSNGLSSSASKPCNSVGPNTETNNVQMADNKEMKKAVVTIINNAVRLQGNTGIPGRLHKLKCQLNDDPNQTWQVFFSTPIVTVTSGENLIVVACSDGSLHIFNTANTKTKGGLGERLLPPLQLPSAISKLNVYKNRLAIITCCAHLYIWDLGEGPEKLKAVMTEKSIEYLLQPGDIFVNEDEEQEMEAVRVSKLSFTEPDGKVFIVTSAGKTFIYNTELNVWLKLADTYSWVQSASNYSSAVSSLPKQNENRGMPLASLTYGNAPNAPKLQSVSDETQRLASITHCQEQAVAALNLGSIHEYRFWYLEYIKHLAEGGADNIDRIRGELSCLLRQAKDNESNKILGKIEATDLLKSVLKVIAGNLELQRVYAEYDEQIKFGWGTSSEDVKDVDAMLLG